MKDENYTLIFKKNKKVIKKWTLSLVDVGSPTHPPHAESDR